MSTVTINSVSKAMGINLPLHTPIKGASSHFVVMLNGVATGVNMPAIKVGQTRIDQLILWCIENNHDINTLKVLQDMVSEVNQTVADYYLKGTNS